MKLLRNHPTFPGIPQEVDVPIASAPKFAVLDAGALPVGEFSYVVMDAAITAASVIVSTITGVGTGKDADEIFMDSYEVDCIPAAGQFTAFVRGREGYLADKFTLNYIAG